MKSEEQHCSFGNKEGSEVYRDCEYEKAYLLQQGNHSLLMACIQSCFNKGDLIFLV